MTLSEFQGHCSLVTHLLQAFSNATFRTVLQQLTGFSWRSASRGPSAIAELLALYYVSDYHLSLFSYSIFDDKDSLLNT